ncbi:hypothetical protein F3J20_25275 [Paraburkholderia sp. Cy-641]|uniref:hypothetical protein n=1 Tax=Paraburkholderia sp. Cy-641 TaxID=2608337 RepID=UPI00142453AD|nr:hypothetical protein [Paraburkholderia sp. Cy-641]NIF80658.1 hypothetical protein [Paraburkholderia sp. Cy-641]
MSAPDNSTPKAPPSLLADKAADANAPGAPPGGSRILANLEGRVVPPASPPREGRSRAPLAVAALLVIGAAAFGAWHVFERGEPAGHATPAVVAAVDSGAKAPAVAAASAPQAATIVADDDSAGAKQAANEAADAGASAAVPDDARLSRALADGARDAGASAPSAGAVPTVPIASASANPNRKHAAKAAETRHEAKAAGHAANAREEALAKKRHDKRATGQKDDSDADLLAVLVARTKPANGKDAAVHTTKAKAQAGKPLTLAEQVKACGERGFFEDQLCRWRVCDGHWGKDPVCPEAARVSTEH